MASGVMVSGDPASGGGGPASCVVAGVVAAVLDWHLIWERSAGGEAGDVRDAGLDARDIHVEAVADRVGTVASHWRDN